MHVVATAGHVDHGKSTLVRALTGMEPDRWEEERRRGLTIDLGFAWTTLPSGRDVAFVDVPGHERFLGNMLAGLGPAPVVLFVVAADEGWRAQSGDHRDAVEALGIDAGVVVLSRADLAPVGRVAEVLAQVREELAGTGLRDAPAVVASGTTGAGLDALRSTLDEVLGRQPAPPESARVRLWVDRAFTVTGAGTVVTGTLPAGSIASGDALELLGPGSAGAGFPWSRRDIDHDNLTPAAGRTVVVRGLQSEGRALPVARPVSRVALNLRGIPAADVRRGDALVSPGAWRSTSLVDIRRVSGPPLDTVPERLGVHVGTAAVRARVRPLGVDHARLTLARPLPLTPGDRLVLRDPGSGLVAGGQVLDVEPPAFRRRGDAARRASALQARPEVDVAAEVARRGAVRREHLARLGLLGSPPTEPPAGVRVVDGWWVDRAACATWSARLAHAVAEAHAHDPLAPGLSTGAARDLLGLPDALMPVVVAEAGLVTDGGYVRGAAHGTDLGPAEAAVADLERRLAEHPFRAPEATDLAALGLGPKELAAAARVGRLLRLDGGVVLLPSAPALAMRTLAGLDQPFTTSAARQALDTTRRVVIPLLEHLDTLRWTRRLDAGHREVVRDPAQ